MKTLEGMSVLTAKDFKKHYPIRKWIDIIASSVCMVIGAIAIAMIA